MQFPQMGLNGMPNANVMPGMNGGNQMQFGGQSNGFGAMVPPGAGF